MTLPVALTLFALHSAKQAARQNEFALDPASIDGAVTSLSQRRGAKGYCCLYDVGYRYAIISESGRFKTIYTRYNQVDPITYLQFRIGQTVPIIYDPSTPGRSALALRRDSLIANHQNTLSAVVVIRAFGALVLLALNLGLLYDYVSQRKLVRRGMVARTEIIVDEFPGQMRISYRFRDDEGRSILERYGGWRLISKMSEKDLAVSRSGTGTVLYDAANARKTFFIHQTQLSAGYSEHLLNLNKIIGRSRS